MSNERSFLHSIANPLATARFVLDSVMDDLRSGAGVDPLLVSQLQDVTTALDQAVELIRKRREELIQSGVPPGK